MKHAERQTRTEMCGTCEHFRPGRHPLQGECRYKAEPGPDQHPVLPMLRTDSCMLWSPRAGADDAGEGERR